METKHTFKTLSEAWSFMRECDAKGLRTGYPNCTPKTVLTDLVWTVRVLA